MFHMERNITFEIIRVLLVDKNHIREIAKKLHVNHMNVLRNIQKLSNANVVDYEQHGKNKTYFLKKTSEARAYVFMAENYILTRALEKYPELRGTIERLQKDNRIKLALVFGSYAKGNVKHDSDIDVFIETNNRKIKSEIEITDSKLSVKIGKYTPSNLLTKEMEKNHIIVKGVERYYEKNKLFE